MVPTLKQVAQQLKDSKKKAQLFYAVDSSGNTRLVRAFRGIIAHDDSEEDNSEPSRNKILYYNAFSEDMFYWDNDLDRSATPKLKIQPTSFTNWILNEQRKGFDIIDTVQSYATILITPICNQEHQFERSEGETIHVPNNYEVTFRVDLTGTLTKEADPSDSERCKLESQWKKP